MWVIMTGGCQHDGALEGEKCFDCGKKNNTHPMHTDNAPAKTNKERQREHYERMKAAGMKKVCVYVPGDLVDKLRAYAKKLCASVTK